MIRCFKCGAPIGSPIAGATDKEAWECPSGVLFVGGSNFGSTLYDSLFDGWKCEIVVCDACVLAAKGTERLREVLSESFRMNGAPAIESEPDF